MKRALARAAGEWRDGKTMSASDKTIADRLPACTVRIERESSSSGSGFFVAPGVVVTCAHVVLSKALDSADAVPEISIVSTDGSRYQVFEITDLSEVEDLVVLRVEPFDHPCVLLGVGLRMGDELLAFGFPASHPEGSPTTFLAEGWMEGERSLSLGPAQVPPGMSGAPILNRRTGAVCGILRRTLDPSIALGGHAIPVEMLFMLSPALQSANRRYHAANRNRWLNLLPPEQRKHQLAATEGLVGVRRSAPSVERLQRVCADHPGVRSIITRWFRSEGGPAEMDPADPVDCTVFAPPSRSQGQVFLVQVFAHTPTQAAIASARASEFSLTAPRRGYKSLGTEIPRGTTLSFDLLMPGLEVDEPVQSLIWGGRPEAVQFGVTIPSSRTPGTLIGTLEVSIDSVPVGHIKFEFTVTAAKSEPSGTEPEPVGDEARGYTMAFCSYASPDRDEVVRRVQMLSAFGIRYFHDILGLDPGDRWEQKLYERIDQCDLFLLFWSSNAKRSEWVRKEASYALEHKGDHDFAPPEIRPIIIEGPPVVLPWPELSHLHFNDRLLYLLPWE